MILFCMHSWSPYHATEILYLNGDKKHIRLFEACHKCKLKRQVDFNELELVEGVTKEAR